MSGVKEAWAMEGDMDARDPNNLNDHLQITFEEVIGEPDHTHSIDCVWKYSYKCFNMWKYLCYIILTTLCSIIMASCWGCYFACIAFEHIWHITPCIRAYEINIKIIGKVYAICMTSICDPCCESFGKLFSAFKK